MKNYDVFELKQIFAATLVSKGENFFYFLLVHEANNKIQEGIEVVVREKNY
jgi:hypothetical protein